MCSWAGSSVDGYLCDRCAVELEVVLTVICVTDVQLSWKECWRLFVWQVYIWAGRSVDGYLCDRCAVELEGVLTVICVTDVQLSWKECWRLWLFVWQMCSWAGRSVDGYLCDRCAVELEGVLRVICVTGVHLSWQECWWLFVWQVCDYEEVPVSITGQLIWREYFYCMSVNNPLYNRIKGNPICLDIDWYHNNEHFEKWSKVMLPTKCFDLPIKCDQKSSFVRGTLSFYHIAFVWF